ncbi:aminopeptidase [Lysinibacillus macroides]|uniref:Peptidase M29 n=1 Tax=Lysinibacillus macroides TaxID=33935 RepID=A0A0N0CVT4_9BACI|nr:aminopeptidase [Lysinibacillus macroides]KOY81944.1 peptidase M29 [Lysinibacillus macroides]QPR68053.1 aminopeptidase [Lysinibacillus macroides]
MILLLSFDTKLSKYAELALKIGVNIQKGQYLYISCSTDNLKLAQIITKMAYKNGAKQVFMDLTDDECVRARYEDAPKDSFDFFPPWKVQEREWLAEHGAAFLSISSQNPDLLKGIEPNKIMAFQKASGKALANYYQWLQADKFSWSVIAAPSKAWAEKVFPHLPEAQQVDALWEAIFAATRINVEHSVEAWQAHDKELQDRANYLNNKQYKALHYTAPGTDLIIDLPIQHIWAGGSSVNKQGQTFMANMPTEEIFTAPLKTGVNGYVSSTKPLSYGGTIIDNFTITFKEGRIIAVKAEQGQEILTALIETDEGARYLGEVALVPHHSPISQANLLFYNTLFDENASNHLAIGRAYAFCIEGGKEMTPEELMMNGLNQSLTHVDFMIGSNTMNIDGITHDQQKEPIFRNGNWAF